MKKLFLALLFVFVFVNAFAQISKPAASAAALPAFSMVKQTDILEEEEDIKKLVLKYDAAPNEQKGGVKKEITALETKKENERIKKNEERIKRQEEKIKELKALNEKSKKDIKQTVDKKVEYLISKESVEKIKKESPAKKAVDKIKDKK